MRLPPEAVSTISVITRPMPVSETVPTMMPAQAVAMPTEVMLRAARLQGGNEFAKTFVQRAR